MAKHLLYATVTFMKFRIQRDYRNDVHYVWCSEHFDSKKLGAYAPGSRTARSADPAAIYRELAEDVATGDLHSAKITSQRASLKELAIEWEAAGEITKDEKEEIVYMLDHALIQAWRPLLYLIPRNLEADRLELVPIEERASVEKEYIIRDLQRSDFEIIEP